jgi:phosphomannomutase
MMRDPHIIYAGEHSAHYFFRDNYYMDSGVMAAMVFLSVVARSGQSVSEYIQDYKRYITLEETNFAVADPHGSIQTLTEIYQSEKYDLLD